MCDPAGTLRVWDTPWHRRRVAPSLRSILAEHDVEHVLLSHGGRPCTAATTSSPLCDRDPWSG